MAKSKKNSRKPSVKVQDLTAQDNPVGGYKVAIEYKPQKTDGTLDAGLAFKYDISTTK